MADLELLIRNPKTRLNFKQNNFRLFQFLDPGYKKGFIPKKVAKGWNKKIVWKLSTTGKYTIFELRSFLHLNRILEMCMKWKFKVKNEQLKIKKFSCKNVQSAKNKLLHESRTKYIGLTV